MRLISTLILALTISVTARAIDPIPELAPLAPFIGTWQSSGTSVDGSANFDDVSKWEWAFGGKVLRLTHSVKQGAYYGESLMTWDAQQKKIVYRYVNNAGFFTDGSITVTAEGIEVHEQVRGSLTGPTETMSGYSIDADGKMQGWSKLKFDGKWGDVSNFSYTKTPGAQVIFKDD